MAKRTIWVLGIWAALLFGQLAAENSSVLYLSWLKDPTTTMVIQWHSGTKSKSSSLFFRKLGEGKWQKQEGSATPITRYKRLVHTVELTQLEPDTMYEFYLGEEKVSYKFRTCPREGERALKFVVAGDVYYYLHLYRQMNEEIAKKDPDFVVVGGDLAYTEGHKSFFKGRNWEIDRWTTFFQEWKKQMVAEDGRLIPMVPVVGNHDVKNPVKHPKAGKPIFYDLFAMPQNRYSYRTLDFGALSLFLLDTGHIHPIEGEQAEWLKKELSSREKVPYKMAAYHVAAYPSVYPYLGRVPALMRKAWVPLFEEYGIKVAFENHNHAYKRTHPIKEGRIDPAGVIYLGDGAWGVPPRKPVLSADKEWYLAKTSRQNSFWLVELRKEGSVIQSYDINGKLIEKVP